MAASIGSLDGSFAFDQLATSSDGCNQIWFVSKELMELLCCPSRSDLQICHAGIKMFERRSEIRGRGDGALLTNQYRIRQPGAQVLPEY